MREIARVQQGHVPAPTRVVRAVAGLFRLPVGSQPVSVLDAGCGTGEALATLSQCWMDRQPDLRVRLLGIESDKHRWSQAQGAFAPTGGEALWGAIEDSFIEGTPSLLWFNPPYDTIRGSGRMEAALFQKVRGWLGSGGVLVMIIPEDVLSDPANGIALGIAREFDLIGRWRFPDPEYALYGQCVVIARRKARAVDSRKPVDFPCWAVDDGEWPVLSVTPRALVEVPVSVGIRLRRAMLAEEVLRDAALNAPSHGALLREAAAPAPPPGRPLLPLKPGHLALALAGGLCDGVVESLGERFLVKGSLASTTRKTGSRKQCDARGEPVAIIDTYRTQYAMTVRCLREDGAIETYSSAGDAEELPLESLEPDDA